MAKWTSLLKRFLPRRWAASLALLRRLPADGVDLPPGQLAELLRHAHASGIDNLLRLLQILEEEHGHRASGQTGLPADAEGRPLPWFTYPAIAYLDQLDLSELGVFEFGCGAGTQYFARRALEVRSVERDDQWHARIAVDLPANATLVHRPERQDYVAAIAETGGIWDVIVIDGAWRRECARAALYHLAPSGWIILDNADWYPSTAEDLRRADLIQIDFTGLGPVNYYTWTTSFFLRRQVVLPSRGPVQPIAGLGSLPRRGDEGLV